MFSHFSAGKSVRHAQDGVWLVQLHTLTLSCMNGQNRHNSHLQMQRDLEVWLREVHAVHLVCLKDEAERREQGEAWEGVSVCLHD